MKLSRDLKVQGVNFFARKPGRLEESKRVGLPVING